MKDPTLADAILNRMVHNTVVAALLWSNSRTHVVYPMNLADRKETKKGGF